MPRVINAKFMGPTAKELLGRNVTGKIHSTFDRVFNIKIGDTLVGVAREDVYRSQINLITDVSTKECMSALGIRRGMRVRVKGDNIKIGNILQASIKEAEIWHPSTGVQTPSNPEIIKRNLERVKRKVSSIDINEGLGQLLPHLDDILGEEISDASEFNPVAEKALPSIEELAEVSLERNSEGLKAASKGLIGLGLGLTPSGDDMLSGFMIARWWITNSFGAKLDQTKEENASIKGQMAEKTTLFSKQHLRYAAEGETNEAVESFLKSILRDKMKSVDSRINRVIEMGETSGADMMLGLLLGLETALKSLNIQ